MKTIASVIAAFAMLGAGSFAPVRAQNHSHVIQTANEAFPANYAIPAHSHPTDEHVVVVSGALTFGMGEKLTKGAATNRTLTPGGFALMPADMNHFAYTATQATTIVLYGQGPVEFKYVNPADDPRTAKKHTQ